MRFATLFSAFYHDDRNPVVPADEAPSVATQLSHIEAANRFSQAHQRCDNNAGVANRSVAHPFSYPQFTTLFVPEVSTSWE